MTAPARSSAAPARRGEGSEPLTAALAFVTGKGGTGKSTVAAALGLAAAARGERTLVCELEGTGQMPRVFGRRRRASGETRLAPHLWFLAVDPREALQEWMRGQPGGAAAAAMLGRSATFEHFVAAAPGVKELVSVGKAVDLVVPQRAPGRGSPRFDTVVVDCPSTGHALGMFAAPRTMGEVARVGPIGGQARALRDVLADPARSRYVGVTLPEEMAISEVLDLERDLPSATGRPLDLIVVNGVYPDRFTEEEEQRLRAVARRADAPAAVRAALELQDRARLHAEHVSRLCEHARTPVVTLPFLFVATLGRDELETLARAVDHVTARA